MEELLSGMSCGIGHTATQMGDAHARTFALGRPLDGSLLLGLLLI